MTNLLKYEPYILKTIKLSKILSFILMIIAIILLYIYKKYYISELLYLSSIELFKTGILVNLLIFTFENLTKD